MTDKDNQIEAQPVDENKLIAQRREKLKQMREQGNAFPNNFRRDSISGELHAEYDDKSKEELEHMEQLNVVLLIKTFFEDINADFDDPSKEDLIKYTKGNLIDLLWLNAFVLFAGGLFLLKYNVKILFKTT